MAGSPNNVFAVTSQFVLSTRPPLLVKLPETSIVKLWFVSILNMFAGTDAFVSKSAIPITPSTYTELFSAMALLYERSYGNETVNVSVLFVSSTICVVLAAALENVRTLPMEGPSKR